VRNLGLVLAQQKTSCQQCRGTEPDDFIPQQAKSNLNETASRSQQLRHPEPYSLLFRKPLPVLPFHNRSVDTRKAPHQFYPGTFDDYVTPPIWTHVPTISENIWTFDSLRKQILPSFWETWKDFGYRLKPDFFCILAKSSATDFQSRLLPTTEDFPIPSELCPDSPRSCHNEKAKQPICMGAQQMLDESGDVPKSPRSSDVFIRGLTRNGEFIRLDLELDCNHLPLKDILLSVDIDSVIWVTSCPKFKGAINLHLTPYVRDKAPIEANPYIYIELVMPPTDSSQIGLVHLSAKQYSSYPNRPLWGGPSAVQSSNLLSKNDTSSYSQSPPHNTDAKVFTRALAIFRPLPSMQIGNGRISWYAGISSP
jgi:hypothetical protein